MAFAFDWKFFVNLAIPYIHMAAKMFKDKDPGTTGKNEMIGISLDYAADILTSAVNGTPIPAAPAQLAQK